VPSPRPDLVHLRQRLDLSQRAAAAAAHVGVRVVQNAERGHMPHERHRLALSVLYDRPIEELWPPDGPPAAPKAPAPADESVEAPPAGRKARFTYEQALTMLEDKAAEGNTACIIKLVSILAPGKDSERDSHVAPPGDKDPLDDLAARRRAA
jgi:hypothetical protein